MTPDGVHELTAHGVSVVIEHDAGAGSSIGDDAYRAAGAEISTGAADVWARAGLVLKVKEPQAEELERLRPGLVLFTYLHLAAYPAVADALLRSGVTGVAYETVQLPGGGLPLLAPMSEVAGRMAPQLGAHFLERDARRARSAPRRRARRAPRPRRDPRRRQRRVERGVDRAGHGGRGAAARPQPRSPPLGRPDPQGPDHDAGQQPSRRRAGGGRGRPRDRRGAGAGSDARRSWSPRPWWRGCARARCSSTARSTRAGAWKASTRRPTGSPSTSATACCTTPSATSRRRSRTRRRTR